MNFGLSKQVLRATGSEVIKWTAVLLSVAVSAAAFGQWSTPDSGPIFTQDEIPRIHILINPDSLNTLYLEENWYSDYEYSATMVFESSTQMDTLEMVGLRFRGNTSRDKQKKSFKISLNTYVPGRQYFGVEKLNINAEVNDPSLLRSRICWDMLREINIPSSRSNHVELYINGGYYGLYQNIEHIDEELADSRFNSKVGNLYKCTYPADLSYISNNPNDYKVAPWGARTYELKTNEEQDDYRDLAEFIIFLNQTNSADLECRIHEYFNVYQYLKVAAADVLTGHWDGYIYNQNNFYLYHNPLTDQFEYIPYDLDNTLGIDWLDRDWGNRNIYAWSQTGATRPLYNRLMAITSFRNIFSWHIQKMLNENFGTTQHIQAINSLHEFISNAALADPFRPIDFGFTNEIFENSLTQSVQNSHVEYGILPYFNTRRSSAQSQLNAPAIAPIIHNVAEDFEDFPNVLKVRAFISGQLQSAIVLSYATGGGEVISLNGTEIDGVFHFTIPLDDNLNQVSYQITVTGANGLSRNAFCQNRIVSFSNGSDALFINEVMSANQNSSTDETGQHEDWVELFQNSGSSISVSGYYLTDNSSAPLKWRLPDIILPAGSFPLVWADEDLGDGLLHANFKISASGEHLFLFRKTSNGIQLVDEIDLPALPPNYAFGRIADGEMPWVLFENPTPMSSNGNATSIPEVLDDQILPYPNPTADILNFGLNTNFELFDLSGKLIASGKASQLSMNALSGGVYVISFNGIRHRVIKLSGR